ncbi:hypothetical protein QWY82_03030 [Simiduia curdlanivorans]|uniref:Tissue inhibitor of metalloproteinase n=1 Tax=Simiduia curdlanivorans TaxID=1492769 RepID=A0ABV8V1V9_9GAMM|nr:hypothetical protein [Simiduia curdlanivorans]MDN3637774.1 hypothetical protein [Simiduia curdlanivorans]
MKVIVLLLIFTFSSSSYATSCRLEFADAEKSKNSSVDALDLSLNRASHIIIAEAITTVKTVYSKKGEESSIVDFSTAFEVERYIKGKGSKNVTVKRDKICGCSYDYVPGVNYVIFANEKNGILYASSCSYTKPADETWVEIVEQKIGG